MDELLPFLIVIIRLASVVLVALKEDRLVRPKQRPLVQAPPGQPAFRPSGVGELVSDSSSEN